MSLSSRKIGLVVLMLVLAHLFAPAAHALPPSGRQGLSFESVFTAAWEWLTSILAPDAQVVASVGTKAGSHMDPDGNK